MKRTVLFILFGLACFAITVPVAAQEHPRSIALSLGAVGSLDEDETGFGNLEFQARFAVDTGRNTMVAVRLGEMDFGDLEFKTLTSIDIDYITVSGDYMFDEPSYRSGLFMGLGFYQISATGPSGRSGDESGAGLVLGAVGEFPMADKWFILGESSFHYTNLDLMNLFFDLKIGVGFRF